MSSKEMVLLSSSGWSVIVTKPDVKISFNAADIATVGTVGT
jgi:hypothetical protein